MNIRDHPLHVVSFALLAFAVLTLSACAPTGTPNDTPTACTMDAMQCPDGSYVGRTGPDCEFVCPDTTETPTATTFKQYIGTSAEICTRIRFMCESGEMFSDETGCGCVREHNNAAVTLCQANYDPICGWSGPHIQCLVYPCAQTYSNLCMASVDPNVAYTTPGECPAPGSSPVPSTVDAKYDELAAQYRESLGATLERCVGDETVYVVEGSGGFTGIAFYYDVDGKQIGTYEWDDIMVIGEEEARPPIDKTEYTCTTLKKTTSTPQTSACSDPRPEACTMQYDPVCAQKKDGTSFTAGNACSACSDEDVVSHVPGECEIPAKLQAIDCTTRSQACTREYMPVCGQREDGSSNTYGNKCTACANSNVLSYTEGACA